MDVIQILAFLAPKQIGIESPHPLTVYRTIQYVTGSWHISLTCKFFCYIDRKIINDFASILYDLNQQRPVNI
jgi:hypothetical protein